MGIEPTFKAWEALVLPLNYTREFIQPSSMNPCNPSSALSPANFFVCAILLAHWRLRAASLQPLLDVELSFDCRGGLRPVDLSEEPAATLVARYLFVILGDAFHLIANKPYDHVFGVFV